ncbi:MAG TPA: hypothetical protein DD806_06535 [Flavobacterium sp.]|nr:hypothetical protein [Flavobacterium sp.]
MSTQSTFQKILARPRPSKLRTDSMSSNVEELVSTRSLPDRLIPTDNFKLNLNAKQFYPPGEKERIEKMKLVKIEEDKYYDNLEKVWWEQNKNMFEDSLDDSKCLLRNMSKQEIKLKPVTLPVIEEKIKVETVSSTSWADIVKKI